MVLVESGFYKKINSLVEEGNSLIKMKVWMSHFSNHVSNKDEKKHIQDFVNIEICWSTLRSK